MQKRTWWWVGGLAGGWMIFIGLLQWFKFQAFAYNGLDLGIYTQVLWSLSHGHGFASSIHDPSYLGDHLELWLVPLAGLYRLWSHPLTALWTQTLVLALSVTPLAWLTKKVIGEKFVPIVVGIWLLHPLLYNAALYEFHALVFALPISLWMIVAYLNRQYRLWILLGIGLLLVREDMPLLLAGWAVYAALERRSWRWWLVPAVLAIGYFIGAQAIIQAHSPLDTYKYLAFYRWLGNTPSEMLTFPFRHPVLFLGHFFSIQNWQTVIGFLLLFGLLPLLRPQRLWPLVFVFIQLLLLGASADSILRLHYVIPYLPFLLWASLEGWQRLASGSVWPKFDRTLVVMGGTIFALVAPLYGHFLYGALEWPWQSDQYASRTPVTILRAGVDSIHPDDRVLTTFNLLPALDHRSRAYSLNYVHLGRRQYTETRYDVPTPIDVAVIDWQQYYDFQFFYKTTAFEGLTGNQRLQKLLDQNHLTLDSWTDGLAIYRRGGKIADDGVTSVPDATVPKSLQLARPAVIKKIEDAQGFHQLSVELAWQLPSTPEQPWSIRFSLIQNGSPTWTSVRLLGNGLSPAATWAPGQAWTTTYHLAVPKRIAGPAELRIEVLALDGRVRLDRWRSFVPRPTELKPIFQASLGSLRL